MDTEEEDFASASEGEPSPEPSPINPRPATDFPAPKSLTVKSVAPEPAPPIEPSPEPHSNSTKQEPPTAVKSASNAGAWSWGGFLSSAVSAVAESLQSDMNSLVHNAKDLGEGIKKYAEVSVDHVYEQLDPPTQKNAAEDSQGGQSSSSATSPRAVISTAGLMQSTETVLKGIDSAFDVTSDLLGNAVLGGYRTLEKAKLGEKIGEIKSTVGHLEVLQHSKEAGASLLAQGLTALEAIGSVVGKNAALTLAEKAHKEQIAKVDERGLIKGTKREATLVDYFEDNCGNAHLQALEMLATESNLKVKSMDSSHAIEKLKELETIFDMDDVLEEVTEVEQSKLLDEEGLKQVQDVLSHIQVNNHKQIIALRDFIGSTAESLRLHVISISPDVIGELKSDTIGSQVEKIKKHFAKDLSKLHTFGMKGIADYAEKSCEQILRIAEILLMLIAEYRLNKDDRELDPVSIAQNIRLVCISLLSELNFLSQLLESNIKRTETETIDAVKPLFSAANEDVRDELVKSIQLDVKKLTNDMEIDLSSAMSFVQDAVHSTLPILKLMQCSIEVAPAETNEKHE